ncbi:MAG: aldo/keto reductase [Chloroflexi bacterium]|nr:aldo/keto reductase [Chloroflexota bacterium]
MEYRNLGNTGLKVSELCLGTMQFGWTADEPASYEVMSAAWEAGIRFWDTADVYSNWAKDNPGGVAETLIGQWMRTRSIPRDQIVIATKVRGKMGPGPNDEGLTRRWIMRAVEASLRRLQTDYVDLYQTHFPDEATPIEETLRALDDLVHQGKARYVGCSNYRAWQLMQALWVSDKYNLARYDCLQPHYSLVNRAEYERELESVCRSYGIGVIPYSPLGGGFLTGKYRQGQSAPPGSRGESSQRVQGWMTERNWSLLDKLEELGRARGKSISQMALGWLLTRPGIISPIVGPKNVEQLNDNLGAVGLRLAGEEMTAMEEASAWQ